MFFFCLFFLCEMFFSGTGSALFVDVARLGKRNLGEIRTDDFIDQNGKEGDITT